MKRNAPALALFAIGALLVVVLPFQLTDFRQFQLAYVGVFFIAALGLNVLTGISGQISLGQGGFMMIGAYTTAILSANHGIDAMLTIPLGGLVAGVAGFLFGLPAVRFRGVYLALATFAVPIALIQLAKKFEGFTGGGGGIRMTHVVNGSFVYWRTWAVAGVLTAFAWFLLRGRFGRALRTIRESEIAAVSSGVNITLYKAWAFAISAAYAGVAGGLFAIAIASVNPDTFPINLSILLLTGVVVGGLGSLWGAVFGALFIEFVPLYAPNVLGWIQKVVPLGLDPKAAGAGAVIYGVLLLIVLLAFPGGAAGLVGRARRF
jgi:branched-chain amino acid transport system permease protein